MSDRDTVLSVLTHGTSQNISFAFTSSTGATVTVSRTTFQRVAAAIRTGQANLVITPRENGTLPKQQTKKGLRS